MGGSKMGGSRMGGGRMGGHPGSSRMSGGFGSSRMGGHGHGGFGSRGMGTRKGSKSCLKKCVSVAGMGSRKISGSGFEKRSISFGKQIGIREIEHIDDMPESQVNAMWLHPAESDQIREEAIRIVERADAGEFVPESELRGLEGHLETNSREREEIRENVYDAVLGVQEFQRRQGVNMPNAMANVYRKHSQRSQIEAHQKAMRDTMVWGGM